jgi:hypothetical protein
MHVMLRRIDSMKNGYVTKRVRLKEVRSNMVL